VADCSANVPIGAQPPCPAHPFRMPEEAPPGQQVRPLPGLGGVPERLATSGARGNERILESAVDDSPRVSVTLDQSRHEGLAGISPGRAPEALDI
jgi:hypothetical protein